MVCSRPRSKMTFFLIHEEETCFQTCSDLIFLDFSGSLIFIGLVAYDLKRYLIKQSNVKWVRVRQGRLLMASKVLVDQRCSQSLVQLQQLEKSFCQNDSSPLAPQRAQRRLEVLLHSGFSFARQRCYGIGQAVNVRSQAVTSMYVVLQSVCVSRVASYVCNRFDHSYFLLLFFGWCDQKLSSCC